MTRQSTDAVSTADQKRAQRERNGTIHVSLGKDLLDKVRRVAVDQERPAAYVIKKAVENYLKNLV